MYGWDGYVFGNHNVGIVTDAGFSDVELGIVLVGRKDHAAGVVDDTFVGGGGNLVDELVYGGHSFSGGGGFLGADFSDGNK